MAGSFLWMPGVMAPVGELEALQETQSVEALCAQTFVHPVFPNRRWVRLVGASLLASERIELTLRGFLEHTQGLTSEDPVQPSAGQAHAHPSAVPTHTQPSVGQAHAQPSAAQAHAQPSAAQAHAQILTGDLAVVEGLSAVEGPAAAESTLGGCPVVGWTIRRAPSFLAQVWASHPHQMPFALRFWRALSADVLTGIAADPLEAYEVAVSFADGLTQQAPALLPAFWESIGRHYITQGFASRGKTDRILPSRNRRARRHRKGRKAGYKIQSPMTAVVRCFREARRAERLYGVSIDEDTQYAVFLEFSLAGVLSVKQLVHFAKKLRRSRQPQRAYRCFLALCVNSVRTHLPLPPVLRKPLRRLARAAGACPLEAERTLLRAALTVPLSQPISHQKLLSYAPGLRSLAHDVTHGRSALDLVRNLKVTSADLFGPWMALLHELGLAAAILNQRASIAAEQFEVLLKSVGECFTEEDAGRALPAAFWALFEDIASAFRERRREIDPTIGTPDLLGHMRWRGRRRWVQRTSGRAPQWGALPSGRRAAKRYRADILMRCLEMGLNLESPEPCDQVQIEGLSLRSEAALAAHPEFALHLSGILLDPGPGFADTSACAQDHPPVLAQANRTIRQKIAQQIAVECHRGGLYDAHQSLAKLAEISTVFEALPESEAWAQFIGQTFARFDAAQLLAQSVRSGLFEELRWPQLEAILDARGLQGQPISYFGSIHHPIVRVGGEIFIFHGAEFLKSMKIPEEMPHLWGLFYVSPRDREVMEGSLLFYYADIEGQGHRKWSHEFQQKTSGLRRRAHWLRRKQTQIAHDIPLGSGHVWINGEAIELGGRAYISDLDEALVFDGQHFFEEPWRGRDREQAPGADPEESVELQPMSPFDRVDPYGGFISRRAPMRPSIPQDELGPGWPRQMSQRGADQLSGHFTHTRLWPAPSGGEGSLFGVSEGFVGGWCHHFKQVVATRGRGWRGRARQRYGGPAEAEAQTVYTYTRVDGQTMHTISGPLQGCVQMPGGGPMVGLRLGPTFTAPYGEGGLQGVGYLLIDDEGRTLSWAVPTAGEVPLLPMEWLPFLRPRDAQVSARLRALCREDARRLIQAFAQDAQHSGGLRSAQHLDLNAWLADTADADEADSEEETQWLSPQESIALADWPQVCAASQALLGVTDAVIQRALVRSVHQAWRLEQYLERAMGRAQSQGSSKAMWPAWSQAVWARGSHAEGAYVRASMRHLGLGQDAEKIDFSRFFDEVSAVAEGLTQPTQGPACTVRAAHLFWLPYVEHWPRAMLFLATRAEKSHEESQQLWAFLASYLRATQALEGQTIHKLCLEVGAAHPLYRAASSQGGRALLRLSSGHLAVVSLSLEAMGRPENLGTSQRAGAGAEEGAYMLGGAGEVPALMTEEAAPEPSMTSHRLEIFTCAPSLDELTAGAKWVAQGTLSAAQESDWTLQVWAQSQEKGPVPYNEVRSERLAQRALSNVSFSQGLLLMMQRGFSAKSDLSALQVGQRATSRAEEAALAYSMFIRDLNAVDRVQLLADATRSLSARELWTALGEQRICEALQKRFGSERVFGRELLEALRAHGLTGDLRRVWSGWMRNAEQHLLRGRERTLRAQLGRDVRLVHPRVSYELLLLFLNLWQLTPVGEGIARNLPQDVQRLRSLVERGALIELDEGGGTTEEQHHWPLDAYDGTSEMLDSGVLQIENDDILVVHQQSGQNSRYLRVEALSQTDDKILSRICRPWGGGEADLALPVVAAVRFLRSEEGEIWAQRLQNSPVPVGAFEGDPRQSAPWVVAAIRQQFSLSEEAAALYLLALAHPRPTQGLICRLLGWSASTYRQVGAELIRGGLLERRQRDESERDYFLPGPWVKQGRVWLESWKIPLYSFHFEQSPQLLMAWHRAFERVWARIQVGDRPGFEPVETGRR